MMELYTSINYKCDLILLRQEILNKEFFVVELEFNVFCDWGYNPGRSLESQYGYYKVKNNY